MEEKSPLPLESLPPKSEILRAAYMLQRRYLVELQEEVVYRQKVKQRSYFVLKVVLCVAALLWAARFLLKH